MELEDLENNEEFQSLIGQDPKALILELRKNLFKRRKFDFIVNGTANNSEMTWQKGEDATHEKQKQALEILTANEYDQFLYGGAAGGAKAQPLDAKIYTPFGYKLMGDIKVGDVIKSPSGGNTNVIAIHPQGKKKIYEVEFIDGAKTKCCGEHLWKVWYSGNKSKQEKTSGKGKIQTTEMLIKNLHKKPIIPLSEPLEFTLPVNRYTTSTWDVINPYVLGCLIGDGGLTQQVGFTTADKEILSYIEQRIDKKFSISNLKQDYSYSIVQNERNEFGYPINEMYEHIKELGLDCKSEFKFIPEKYKHSSIEKRIELSQGLMDTDGTIDKRGHCSFSTSSERLAYDFQYILRSLGFKVTKTKHKTTNLDSFRLYIQGNDNSILFKLKRKKERITKFNGGFSESGRRIISIKEIGYEEAKCITVDSLDSLYVTDDFIVTHNSFTGMSWIVFSALCYPNTRYFIARNELKDIRESVLVTFGEVCDFFGVTGFKYNSVLNFIKFENGSEINLIEVKYKPSDPEYKDVGSTLYTSGWFEEVGEIHEKAVTVLTTRVNRWNVDKYDLKGIVFLTGNPSKNWTKTKFYDKDRAGQLDIDNLDEANFKRKYLSCLVTENPFISHRYISSLRKQASNDKAIYERLFKGNWDYDENPYQLAEQEMIDQIFDNNQVQGGKGYITADVARFGSDKARIGYWVGWDLRDVISLDISKTTDVELAINTFRFKYKIPKNRVVIDDDGVGGGVTDGVGGKGFKNNGKPIKINKDMPNYKNLQVQCLYMLADKINEGGINISADLTSQEKEDIKAELAQIQSKGDQDPERKLDCKSKGDIKQDIGRSPDWRDMIFMRVWFDLKRPKLNLTTNWS